MSQTGNIVINTGGLPIGALLVLGAIFVAGLFLVGYDQGHILSVIQGADAFEFNFLHELFHDVRHGAGLPCH